MTPDAPIRTPSDVYRVVALIAEVLQSMERDTTTASLLAAAGAAEYLRTHIDDHVSVPSSPPCRA
ncbi:hypothetical protein B7495_17115 [Cryobacterium sp. LW097]|uniref:hypothetical protein n=1 Tax=Cryobacterium sp. LW097 TaxID=1978566 RepID=UPI000B4DB888|nr:hypothetical protein [Cryobacterium sp. LW097]ASD23630.1 hypothetical protein B7495_17115 [Cryobacterium sp. LW097]